MIGVRSGIDQGEGEAVAIGGGGPRGFVQVVNTTNGNACAVR